MTGDRAANWRGGRRVRKDGYVEVQQRGHPRAYGHGFYVKEHVLVMEKKLGRYLKRSETVHHIDGNRSNNDPSNLQLRQGRHGKGAVFKCADCGSYHIISEPLPGPTGPG